MAKGHGRCVILITGCSSGIGRSASELLAGRGHIVYATARREESVQDLHAARDKYEGRLRPARLDVTEPDTIKATIEQVLSDEGRIDALVNNAGFGQPGAVEDLPADRWRRQFEVNLFGLIETTRAVLPQMRARRAGRIVNVSSVVAHATLPLMSAYNASKHALEAVNDALRMELRPWGIQVSVVEPGAIQTQFSSNVEENRFEGMEQGSPYAPYYRAFQRSWKRNQRKGAPPRHVAEAIRRAIESPRPKTRYRVTATARLLPAVTFLLGDRITDYLLLTAFGLLKAGEGQDRD